jgi:arylsulfatase A-like enzyme
MRVMNDARIMLPVTPRRLAAALLLCAAVFTTGCRREPPPATDADRPNILFILLDDIRWDAVGYAGHPHLRTPQIDRIANEGVNFANAFCTTSLCSPSRASLLSGLYAHRHGVTDNFTEYPATLSSFPRTLQQAGYETAYVGKYHMGEDNDEPRPGFDDFVTHRGQGQYFDTEFNFNGERREVVKGYYTTVVTDMAIEWLDRARDDRPWLLMVGHKAPHSFYTPEPKYERTFEDVRIAYPESAFELDDKPAWIRERHYTWHGIYGPLFDWRKKFPDDRPEAVADFANMVRAYWGTILSVDDSVGRLLAWLEDRQQLDNTVVVFLGDNGLLEGEHGMVDKRTMHEGSIRIPLAIRYPGLSRSPRVVEQQVLTVDMAPSLLELTGAPALEGIDGRSWVRLVTSGDPDWRTSWFYYYNYEHQFPYTPNVRGVRTDEWKYVRYPHGDGGPDRHMAELYNLRDDPEERRNLIADPALAGTIAELNEELLRLMAATGLTPETDTMPIDAGIKTELPDQRIR